MDLFGLVIELGLNVVLMFVTEGEALGKTTYALVSFARWDLPVVRLAEHEHDTLDAALREAWQRVVFSPDSPLRMYGVGGQRGWVDYLSGLDGIGFSFVYDALSKGEELPTNAQSVNLEEWFKAHGIDPSLI